MKIVFLCGCLEPGRDGVGDYVRRLAGELQQQGNLIQAIALNDYYVRVDILEDQETPNGALKTLRLPAIKQADLRFTRAKRWIDKFNPDWLSLQFVPYAFDTRGLPFTLAQRLTQVGKNRRWHMMMHELWIGMSTEAPLQHVWLARVQRFVIKRLIQQLQPKVIHTHTFLYQVHLTTLGFTSHYLPLFSNIANAASVRPSAPPDGSNSSVPNDISLVLFGFIHPGSPVELLVQDAARFAYRRQVSVSLTMVGRCGSEQDHWAKCWRAAGLPVKILGEQSSDVISQVLLESSLGIVTTPALLLGKSGTAAAMREHGLPTLCVSAPWDPRGIRGISDLPHAQETFVYHPGEFETYLTAKPDTKNIKLPAIARQLTESLLASM